MQFLLFLIGVYYTFRGIKRAVLNLSAGRAPWCDARVPQIIPTPRRMVLPGSRPDDV